MTNVTIYSSPTCPHCHAAKEFLTKNKIKFTDKDVTANPEFAKEAQEKSKGTAVPVIEIDGQIVVGFDEGKISQLLKL